MEEIPSPLYFQNGSYCYLFSVYILEGFGMHFVIGFLSGCMLILANTLIVALVCHAGGKSLKLRFLHCMHCFHPCCNFLHFAQLIVPKTNLDRNDTGFSTFIFNMLFRLCVLSP